MPHSSSALLGLTTIPLVQAVFDVIARHGGEARLVGGAVRDALLIDQALEASRAEAGYAETENLVPDLDMAMTLRPQDAMTALRDHGLKVVPTGLAHGTITVFDAEHPAIKIELTTLRHDVETDGRHAEVAFTDDWAADAARRDFTFNAIYLDRNAAIFDPFNGIADLNHHRIRFIGDADTRIKEDYLRILRFFRFYARFGSATAELDRDAMDAIIANAPQLKTLSGERVAMEMDKMMALDRRGLSLMVKFKINYYLAQNDFEIETYEQFLAVFGNKIKPSLAGRYAALLPVCQHQDWFDLVKAANHRRDAVAYISSQITNIRDWSINEDISFYAYSYRPDPEKPWAEGALAERYALSMIRQGLTPDAEIVAALMTWVAPEFPVKGRDLIDAGFEAGQALGQVLDQLEAHWHAHHFSPSKSDLLSLASGLDDRT